MQRLSWDFHQRSSRIVAGITAIVPNALGGEIDKLVADYSSLTVVDPPVSFVIKIGGLDVSNGAQSTSADGGIRTFLMTQHPLSSRKGLSRRVRALCSWEGLAAKADGYVWVRGKLWSSRASSACWLELRALADALARVRKFSSRGRPLALALICWILQGSGLSGMLLGNNKSWIAV